MRIKVPTIDLNELRSHVDITREQLFDGEQLYTLQIKPRFEFKAEDAIEISKRIHQLLVGEIDEMTYDGDRYTLFRTNFRTEDNMIIYVLYKDGCSAPCAIYRSNEHLRKKHFAIVGPTTAIKENLEYFKEFLKNE